MFFLNLSVENIFLPSVGVDVVFNISSLTPYSRSSIIYDTNFSVATITIAQPLASFTEKTVFKELHLTTIVHDMKRKIRVGVACPGFKVVDQYRLANQSITGAVVLRYRPPVVETNIRSAFRLPISTKFIIDGKIFYKDVEFVNRRHFIIRDISLTGIGILIPRSGTGSDPLSEIAPHEDLRLEILLIDTQREDPVGSLPLRARLVRKNPVYSDKYILLGLKILDLSIQQETILNKFIHEAQIDTLKRMSGRSS